MRWGAGSIGTTICGASGEMVTSMIGVLGFGAALPRVREAVERHLTGPKQAVADEKVCAVIRGLRRRRSGGDELLAYRTGRTWRDISTGDITDYLREISEGDFTAKDFRTWHATVLAAVGLAVSKPAAASESARKRAIARVVREVADYLGNTPAVARASYIDPRIIELYERGTTIEPALKDLGKDRDMGELAITQRINDLLDAGRQQIGILVIVRIDHVDHDECGGAHLRRHPLPCTPTPSRTRSDLIPRCRSPHAIRRPVWTRVSLAAVGRWRRRPSRRRRGTPTASSAGCGSKSPPR
jgi:hypothetical protein